MGERVSLHVLCQVVLHGRGKGALVAFIPVHFSPVRHPERFHVRLHVLPSFALKVVFVAYVNLLFDTQRPDIKYKIFLKFEIC